MIAQASTQNTTITVPLTKLHSDEEYQPRGNGLDKDNLECLMASDPETWPPILVTPDGDGFAILDGAHRLEAAKQLKVPALHCIVIDDGGYYHAVEANLRHGLPLSKADRKDYARWLHSIYPDQSYREIGKRCGLSDKTVKMALSDGDSGAEYPRLTRPTPDALTRLVSLLEDAASNKVGTDKLAAFFSGKGASDQQAKHLRKIVDSRPDDSRRQIAQSLDTLGRACITAATPYLAKAGK